MFTTITGKKMIVMDQNQAVRRQLANRRAQLLQAIGDRTMEPSIEVVHEIETINQVFGDADLPAGGDA